jgi:protein-S-isoprenylcysteine O-methyltransferase Ste14
MALGRLQDAIAAHRVPASRLVALAFFALALATGSAHEGTMLSALLFVFGLALAAVATVGRLWCALYISGYKNGELVTEGPFSLTRNPLYLFNTVGIAGIGFATETVSLGLVLFLSAVLFYPGVIRGEEVRLRARFGEAFERYRRETPRLLPRWSGLREPATYTVNPRDFRRSMGDVLWFVWLAGSLEIVEAIHEYHILEPLWRLP